MDFELLHGGGGIGEVGSYWMKGCRINRSFSKDGNDVELG